MNSLMLFLYLLSAQAALDSSQSRTVTIDPMKDRGAIRLAVHHDRPTLLVFDRAPDGKMIASDDSRWYISTPGNGLPDHAFHFKPKILKAGTGNAFFFFDGYPVEIVYESTEQIRKATTLLYVIVDRQSRKGTARLDLDAKRPVVANTHKGAFPKSAPPVHFGKRKQMPKAGPDFRMFQKEKKNDYGLIRWSKDKGSVYYEPNKNMAGLVSVEIVRAKKPIFSKHFKYAHPLETQTRKLEEGHLIEFDLVHLARREHYYLRLFFEGSREPAFVKLRGLGRAP